MTTAVSAMRLFSVPPECPSSEKKQCSRELDCIQQQLLTKERVTLPNWFDIKPYQMRAVREILSSRSLTVTHLDLSGCLRDCVRTSDALNDLSSGLGSNTTLISVVLQKNGITTRGALKLAEGLLGNKTLTHLDLTENNISDTAKVKKAFKSCAFAKRVEILPQEEREIRGLDSFSPLWWERLVGIIPEVASIRIQPPRELLEECSRVTGSSFT